MPDGSYTLTMSKMFYAYNIHGVEEIALFPTLSRYRSLVTVPALGTRRTTPVAKLHALVAPEAAVCLELGAGEGKAHILKLLTRPIHSFYLRIYTVVNKKSQVFYRLFLLYVRLRNYQFISLIKKSMNSCLEVKGMENVLGEIFLL